MNKIKTLDTLANELEQELSISQKAQEEITPLKVGTQPRTKKEFATVHAEGEIYEKNK